MVARRIALVKPASVAEEKVTHALQLFDSILWAFQGTTRSTWTSVDPEAAEVIVIHQGNPDERLPGWRAGGKLIVEIALRGTDHSEQSPALVYPFRASQALALLERLDAQLSSPADGPAPDLAAAAGQQHDPWGFVETLRTIGEVQNSDAWLVARDAKVPYLWLRADGALYVTDQRTVQNIRRGTLNLAKLKLHKSPAPSDGPGTRPGAELSWFAGYHASAELAPWLDTSVRYRISHWPNFGLIRPLPSHIRIAAALASTPGRVSEIGARAHVSVEEATRTVNALAVANVLVAADQAVAATKAAATERAAGPRGGLAGLLRGVRKHLGLGA